MDGRQRRLALSALPTTQRSYRTVGLTSPHGASSIHGMSMLIGVDLVAVATVTEMLDGPMRERYLARVFTAHEIEQSHTANGIDPGRLAACFAAKEAAMKVLPADVAIPLPSIELHRGPDGATRVQLTGRAADLAIQAQITALSVSVASDGGYALAAILAEQAD